MKKRNEREGKRGKQREASNMFAYFGISGAI